VAPEAKCSPSGVLHFGSWARLHSGYNLILHSDLGCAILIKSININLYECTNNFQRYLCTIHLHWQFRQHRLESTARCGECVCPPLVQQPSKLSSVWGLASILGNTTWSCLWLHSLNYFSSSPSRFLPVSPSKLDHVLSAPQPSTTGHSTAHCCILQDDWCNLQVVVPSRAKMYLQLIEVSDLCNRIRWA
jgi:hypothetical protein